jgi:phosphopantetheinyl transferase
MGRELWALDLEQDPVPLARWFDLLPLLSPSRRQRAARLRDPLKARQVIAAEALLRVALTRRIGAQARTLALEEDGFGKPRFAGRPDIGFNLSHSGR